MNTHQGDNASVMDLYPSNAERKDVFPPACMSVGRLGQQSDDPLDGAKPTVGFVKRQAKSAAGFLGTGADVLEFAEVLGRGHR